MNFFKKLRDEHSLYLLVIAFLECILSLVATISFVYTDTLNYSDSLIIQNLGIQKLLESIYSSTWWALILLLLFFIALFTVLTIVYKDIKFLGIAIGCWIEMLILSVNLNNSIIDSLMNIAIFIPIIILNSIAYGREKEKLESIKKTKKKTSK